MKFKLYNKNNDVIFSKEMEESDFLIMKFIEEAKSNNVDISNIDIKKTLSEINKNKNFCIKSVMVLDDEVTMLKCYKMYLTRINHYVETFENAKDALESFKKDPNRFEVILTDQNMPDENGIGISGSEFVQKVFDNYNKDVVYYIISGDPDTIDETVNDVPNYRGPLAKPINLLTFAMTVGGSGSSFLQEQFKKVSNMAS